MSVANSNKMVKFSGSVHGTHRSLLLCPQYFSTIAPQFWLIQKISESLTKNAL